MGIIHAIKARRTKASAEPAPEYLVSDDISNGRECNKVPAISYKKNDAAPNDFHYVTEFVQSEPVGLDASLRNMACCKCVDDCRNEAQPCECSLTCATATLTYDSNGRLSDEYPLNAPEVHRECNPACSCNLRACKNRVIQAGSLKRFLLFRTKSRGWGVRALEPLKRGTFVGVYSGELISVEQSNRREDDTYLFNLARSNIVPQQQQQQQQQQTSETVGADGTQESQNEVLIEEYLEQITDSELSSSATTGDTSCASETQEAKCEAQCTDEQTLEDSGCNLIDCDSNEQQPVQECQNEQEQLEAQVVEQQQQQQYSTGTLASNEEHFVCDAKFFGNFTRFINHSCEPNVMGIRTFTKHQDSRFPYIAFFTIRDVAPNEELTLNYGDNYWLVKCKRDRVYCLCKTASCRFTKRTFPKTLAEYENSRLMAQGTN